MTRFARLQPATVEGQMVAILALTFMLLLGVLITLEVTGRDTPIEWAESGVTRTRLQRMHAILENVPAERRSGLLAAISNCHEGYTLTSKPFSDIEADAETAALASRIAQYLNLGPEDVLAGYAELTRNDFSYRRCSESEIGLPMTAIVVASRLDAGAWLNAEVHPHEWHSQDLFARILQYAVALALVGAVALILIRRLSKPLRKLTEAAKRFADGLNVSPVPASGPPDLMRAIQSFNAMQEQVADYVRNRTDTLTAISHDLRTPLTALRIKAEMIGDSEVREDLAGSIDKMERIIGSALEFLRGEARSEPRRRIDLSAMLASECGDFEDAGRHAEFIGEHAVNYVCRPESLARAVRNLIENANKYGDGATVAVRAGAETLDISVADHGPGIPAHEFEAAREPFRRLSKARESDLGGFGLGLAIAEAVAAGHDGELLLSPNEPSGLVATLRLPANAPCS